MRDFQRVGVWLGVWALVLRCSISAGGEIAPAPVNVTIAAQPLERALSDWGLQTGYQWLLDGRGTAGHVAEAVSGRYTPEEALQRLLAKTGLTYEFVHPRTVTIHVPAKPQTVAIEAARTSTSSITPSAPLHLAQVDPAIPAVEPRVAMSANDTSAQSRLDEVQVSVPEILVQGSRVLNMDIRRSRDDVQPYTVFGREELARSGAKDIEDFLKSQLTMSTGNVTAGQLGSYQGNTSSINLRGLGSDQTLILIDGHRTANWVDQGGLSQPDLNGIPLSSIERIEVLPTTASGIYGGSATGGVINVVLRRDYRGVETRLTYGNTFDDRAGNRRVDVNAGVDLEGGRTSVLLAGSYAEADSLLVEDRDFMRRARARIRANNPSTFLDAFQPPLGATTNIQGIDLATFSPVDLTLKSDGTPLNSPITFIPRNYGGVASDGGAQLVANAGSYNLALADTAQGFGGGRQSLLNAPIVKSLTVTVRREFTPRLQGFVDLGASENSSTFDASAAPSTFIVPASSANNPFNEDIQVTTPAFGADGRVTTTLRDQKAIGGVIAQLPKEWRAEMDYTWERTRFSSSSPPSFDLDGAGAAVADDTFNVFRDTNQFGVDFSPYLLRPAVHTPSYNTLRDLAARLSGPFGSLPGGPLTLSALLEHREDAIARSAQEGPLAAGIDFELTSSGQSQTVNSFYIESTLPIVSTRNARPGVQLLEFQLAGRHDEYKTEGANTVLVIGGTPIGTPSRATNRFNSSDPTVGLRYKPVLDVMFRASYGTGFLPPAVNSLVADPPLFTPGPLPGGLTDPLRGDEPLSDITETSGGNKDLRPEQSESWSAGVILTPRVLQGLRASLDWTRIDKTDNIRFLSETQEDLNNLIQFAPERITRGPPSGGFSVGPITTLDLSRINFARARVEAFDFSVDYSSNVTRWGAFNFLITGTRQVHNRTQLAPTADVVEGVGFINGLKWKGNATVGWDYRSWGVAWMARYFDSYRVGTPGFFFPPNVANQGSDRIPSQIYHDLFVRYRFDSIREDGNSRGPTSGVLSGLEVQLTVKNIFDTSPPIDATSPFSLTYSSWGDPRLASYSLTVRKQF